MKFIHLLLITFLSGCLCSKDLSATEKKSKIFCHPLNIQFCDINILSAIYKRDTYTDHELELLINVVDSQCVNNVEFMQFVNELVFISLSRNHLGFINVLINSYQSDIIYKIIESPLSDEINIEELIFKIESEKAIKNDRILKSLKIAKMKSN